ncbi:MAG TPA: HlyD family efflux transporter periplasmic adaptor subunit [Bryobacteraceae bacterium]|nr:HlyD family efflux transporter periplasmic adaptor subunit [Bryobacteraceae bacterium]
MSALSNPTPAPVEQTPKIVTPVAPPAPPGKSGRWKGLIVLAVLAAGIWSAYQFYLKPQQAANSNTTIAYHTAKVVVGPFARSIRISGQTSAREYANVTAPRLRGFESRSVMELLKLVKNGSWIKKGEVLAEIDPGYLVEHVDEIKAQIEQARLDVKKREAEQAVEWEALQQTLRVAKATVDKAQYDLKAAEVRTEIERELLKLALEEGQAKYKQSQLDIPQRKLIHAAEIQILGFTTQRHIRHLNRHAVDIKAYTIFAPMEGMVVLSNTWRGGGESQQVQQGDQLGSGQPLLKVVNPKSMQVEASLNQTATTEIRIGQKATIGLDAFPGLTLTGKVYSIGALAVGGRMQNYYIRNVPVRLVIDGNDSRLIPDLSASADVVVEQQEQATLVPLGAIFRENDKTFVHVKQQDGQFQKREVKLGSANNLQAMALSGVKDGDELRLQ